MIDSENYIKNGLKIIQTLRDQKNFQAALAACQELLKVNPYHRKVQKFLKEVEEEILKENMKKVDRDLDATLGMWKEQRYEELMKIYARLYQYAPQHKRLRKLMEKLSETQTEAQKSERTDFTKRALAAIRELIKQEHFADALQAVNELLAFDPLNAEVQKIATETKRCIIEQKLKANERILDSADFERAVEFYHSLLSIDPTNKKVQELTSQARARLAEQKTLAAHIHLNESVARMKELFEASEYEKTVQACDEILHLDAKNITAKIFHTKAEKIIEEENSEAMVKKLNEARTALAPEYQKEPAKFVRL